VQNSLVKPIDILLLVQFLVIMFFTVNSCSNESHIIESENAQISNMEYYADNLDHHNYGISSLANPKIDAISKNELYPGEQFNIYGNGFGAAATDVEVYIGDFKSEVHSVSQNTITAVVPLDASTGKVYIRINDFSFMSKNTLYIRK